MEHRAGGVAVNGYIYIIISGVLGVLFGSFITMASYRIPRGEDIFIKRSKIIRVIRETLEETGMTTNFILYCMKLDGEYNVACFIGNGDQLKVVTTVHEGLGKMVPIKNVTEGCFGKFNKELFDDMVAKGYNIPL